MMAVPTGGLSMISRSTRKLAVVLGASALVIGAGSAIGTGGAANAATAHTTFTPVADARVQDNTPTRNFGTNVQLGIDASAIRRTFIRFTVSGIVDPVTSVKLRLHVADAAGTGSDSGGSWQLVSDTTWSETGVTWNNQPAIDGAGLGTVGTVLRN